MNSLGAHRIRKGDELPGKATFYNHSNAYFSFPFLFKIGMECCQVGLDYNEKHIADESRLMEVESVRNLIFYEEISVNKLLGPWGVKTVQTRRK